MNILEFIGLYWMDILIVILMVTLICLLWFKGKKREIIQLARYAVLRAEQWLGSKTGQAKKAAAIALVYERLPSVLKLFITVNMIDKWVEQAVDWLQLQLESPELLEQLGVPKLESTDVSIQ